MDIMGRLAVPKKMDVREDMVEVPLTVTEESEMSLLTVVVVVMMIASPIVVVAMDWVKVPKVVERRVASKTVT